ncbi:MAG: hypothetical protein LBP76_09575 [Treponema sp.]|jgi:hypothetical protein|nr:hypothetical protein [Treponema sp.]
MTRGDGMTYLQAVAIKSEMEFALKCKNIEPEGCKNIANKYSAAQWIKCRRLILEQLDKERDDINEMAKLAIRLRGEDIE